VLVALAAFRVTFGLAFFDDSHYLASTLRLAQGALPLHDEMSLQCFGFLLGVPFVKAWTAFFGLTGLAIAYRWFFVAVAAVCGWVVYRGLRPTFPPSVAVPAAAVPLLAPPFNDLTVSYNTIALVAFCVATALFFAAMRDGRSALAACAGLAVGIGAASYPPLAAGAAVFVVTATVMAGDRRLVLPMLAGTAVAVLALLGWMVGRVGLGDATLAMSYAHSNVVGLTSPLAKLMTVLGVAARSMEDRWLLPAFVLGAAACVPWRSRRLRAGILVSLPPAATLIAVVRLAMNQPTGGFGASAPTWLMTFLLIALPALLVASAGGRQQPAMRLAALAAPYSVVSFVLVAMSTSAEWRRGVLVTALAPLAMALVVLWVLVIAQLGGPRFAVVGAGVLITCVLGMLFLAGADDAMPLKLTAMIDHGVYAGVHTLPMRRELVLRVESAGRRWVRPGDRVTFLGGQTAYQLVGGRIYTNAVWLNKGPSDEWAIRYFQRHGGEPDVVFVDIAAYRRVGGPDKFQRHDPLIRLLASRYRLVETMVAKPITSGFSVWVHKGAMREGVITPEEVVGPERPRSRARAHSPMF
jgi:hypothetical protein